MDTTTTPDVDTTAPDVDMLSPTMPVEQNLDNDTAPKRSSRPTTRAGRRAASEAAKAAKAAKAEQAPKRSTAKPTPRRASLESRLAGSIAGIGTAVMVSGVATGKPALQADGQLIVEHSGNIAAALDKVAKDNPAVARALEQMLTAGVWGGLAVALMPVALGIAANHGAIPPGVAAMMGVAVPEGPDTYGGPSLVQ